MVLLDRIELSTSPLPRECSTTELQQQRGTGSYRLCRWVATPLGEKRRRTRPGGGQSSRWIFSIRSCRSCASIDRVAMGRASSRFRPIGSPVSSQKP